jgi:hypothetical protein
MRDKSMVFLWCSYGVLQGFDRDYRCLSLFRESQRHLTLRVPELPSIRSRRKDAGLSFSNFRLFLRLFLRVFFRVFSWGGM